MFNQYDKLHIRNGLMNYKDTKAKCRHLTKFTYKGTLRQVLICLNPPLTYRIHTCTFSHREGGEGYLHTINFDKHLPLSLHYRSIFLDDDILLWSLYS
jgi:hypothetical protein